MTDLLKRWSQLEPGRCQPYPAGAGIGFYLPGIEADWERSTPYYDACALGAVLQAIESHGWDWSLETDAKGYFSEVPAEGVHSGGDTPVHALLSAYLKALTRTEDKS